ncbi:NirA family protein [Methylocella sp. CPCC 101449]|uniref:NirA family protein n=1 Tax=Methylocella sp. CPCC 101449 TaxID=2987531 RepID=UPI0028906BD0|nr:NirA family protein [Methylocella sp. CPCC 101449]MDT2021864.1 NirA family protein [Methylocella sp. CPCC 101449]
MSGDFSTDQKRYLEGFVSGLQSARTARGLAPIGGTGVAGPAEPTGPDAIHLKAQDRTVAAGGKLAEQEKWKRTEHPFDAYPRLRDQAAQSQYPKPDDNFRWRYYGLFYVAPAQNSYMARLRIPNGILKAFQFEGLADLAERCGGGFTDVTTRANLQIREITADHAIHIVEGVQELGLTARGSGADNIRNVTGSPTAGIDPHELIDTREMAREWHYHILNDRSLYGLPRKFNVAFDGGGIIPVLEETNDIGFQAVLVGDGAGVEAGLWMRLALGGISGHRDLARPTGVYCRPDECTRIADAIVRVFIENGNRTDRNKSRLKYVLDSWGFDKFLDAVEEKLGKPLMRIDDAFIAPRPAFDRQAHIGVHRQRQDGLNWIGISLPVGRITCAQMRALTAIAREDGDGDIRLTVWQNLLLSGVPDGKLDHVKARIEACGLDWRATTLRAGLVACTGSRGCKFAAADTKGTAMAIADHVDARLTIDRPVNVHLTGCHHSCAQHYIGDIGFIGARVPLNEDGDTVDGFDLVLGGGFADQAKIGRAIATKIRAEDCPRTVEALLEAWMKQRDSTDETFQAFTARHSDDELRAFAGLPAGSSA